MWMDEFTHYIDPYTCYTGGFHKTNGPISVPHRCLLWPIGPWWQRRFHTHKQNLNQAKKGDSLISKSSLLPTPCLPNKLLDPRSSLLPEIAKSEKSSLWYYLFLPRKIITSPIPTLHSSLRIHLESKWMTEWSCTRDVSCGQKITSVWKKRICHFWNNKVARLVNFNTE